jgi:hypothetical protein
MLAVNVLSDNELIQIHQTSKLILKGISHEMPFRYEWPSH